eukprot:TRINITY_DN4745_c0_g1_i14.p1 TRINITY_DN4745_c0_g1~~TRINITY_DN4745_c0_g1_i14.p1  ORF type:complete len:406 (-),score=25.32 TRINITY_DN4745_c0_g1_i14:93-1310(-)
MTGWTGYNSRLNGLYTVMPYTEVNGRPVYKHMHHEGVGAGCDWCRMWWHNGCWRIGHFGWLNGDRNTCVAFVKAESGDVSQSPVLATTSGASKDCFWHNHNGTAAGQDYSADISRNFSFHGGVFVEVLHSTQKLPPRGPTKFQNAFLTVKVHGRAMCIVQKWKDWQTAWGAWDYIDLGVSPEEGNGNATPMVCASYDGQFISVMVKGAEMVFDVSMWNYTVGNHLVLVKGHHPGEQTRKEGGGRDFIVNADGTISPAQAMNLILGNRNGTLVLLERGDKDACILSSNESCYGTIFSGYQIGKKYDGTTNPRACGTWTEHVDIDMCGQGDAEIIPDWKNKVTIEDLKRIVEEKGYSAITVSNGYPSFGHAALKKFDYQLTPAHCKPITTCCRHPCKIYIYTPPSLE